MKQEGKRTLLLDSELLGSGKVRERIVSTCFKDHRPWIVFFEDVYWQYDGETGKWSVFYRDTLYKINAPVWLENVLIRKASKKRQSDPSF
jgi:hypothetical protein